MRNRFFDLFQPEQLQGEYFPARIGFLNNVMSLSEFARFANNKLNLDYSQVAGNKDKEIEKSCYSLRKWC